jgi:hypothetical protein
MPLGSLFALFFQAVPLPTQSFCTDRASVLLQGREKVLDRPAIIRTASGPVLFWEQSPGRNPSGEAKPPFQLATIRLDSAFRPVGEPRSFVPQWDNEWGPAGVGTPTGNWLASYSAHRDRRTGDRDIELTRLDSRAAKVLGRQRLTQDPADTPFPLNDASPTIAFDPRIPAVFVAWSSGAYHSERPAERAYDDKNIRMVVLDTSGRVTRRIELTDSTELGHELTPALAVRPGSEAPYVVAWLSDSASGQRYDLYLAAYDSGWGRQAYRRATRSVAGVAAPSLSLIRGHLLLAWHDEASGDIRIAEVASDLTLRELGSLRIALSRLPGAPMSQGRLLSAPVLFEAGAGVGVAFVVSRGGSRPGRFAQELWSARLRLTPEQCGKAP